MQRADGSWDFPIAGCEVVGFFFGFEFSLMTRHPDGSAWQVQVGDCVLTEADGSRIDLSDPIGWSPLRPALVLRGDTIESARASSNSELTIAFRSGCSIVSPPVEMYENWVIYGPNDFVVPSTPGGGPPSGSAVYRSTKSVETPPARTVVRGRAETVPINGFDVRGMSAGESAITLSTCSDNSPGEAAITLNGQVDLDSGETASAKDPSPLLGLMGAVIDTAHVDEGARLSIVFQEGPTLQSLDWEIETDDLILTSP